MSCNIKFDIAINVFHPTVLPEFDVVPPKVQSLSDSTTFIFSCTPSENSYPKVYMYTFQLNGSAISEGDGVDITEGVSGSILTVSSLKRSEDSGNYTCMVTNEAGCVTIATYLNVLGEFMYIFMISSLSV